MMKRLRTTIGNATVCLLVGLAALFSLNGSARPAGAGASSDGSRIRATGNPIRLVIDNGQWQNAGSNVLVAGIPANAELRVCQADNTCQAISIPPSQDFEVDVVAKDQSAGKRGVVFRGIAAKNTLLIETIDLQNDKFVRSAGRYEYRNGNKSCRLQFGDCDRVAKYEIRIGTDQQAAIPCKDALGACDLYLQPK